MNKCKKCGTINLAHTKFCRSCGTPLIDEFKSHEFKAVLPAEEDRKIDNFEKCKIFAFIVGLIGCLLFLFVIVFFEHPKYVVYDYQNEAYCLFGHLGMIEFNDTEYKILCLNLGITGFILLFIGSIFNKYSKRPPLYKLADYIEKGIMSKKFYMKNKKIGYIDTETHKVIIPAEYDNLEWKEKNRIFRASKNGEIFLMDITGYRLK